MAKLVRHMEQVPENERKWRGATFFTAVADTEGNADKKIDKLLRKYLRNKTTIREVRDK